MVKKRKHWKKSGLFEKIKQGNFEIRKAKNQENYSLHIYTGLYTDGHFAKMGYATLIYEILGSKCTSEIIIEGKSWYQVYGGKWCDMVGELCKILGIKKRETARRHLDRLEKLNYISYETGSKGVRILVKPIEGAFLRKFSRHTKKKVVSENRVPKERKSVSEKSNSMSEDGTPDVRKSDSDCPKNGHLSDEVNSNITKHKNIKETPTEGNDVVDVLLSILNQPEMGTISKEVIAGLIERKDPDKMIRLANYAKDHATTNLPGYFRKSVEDSPDLPPIEEPEIEPWNTSGNYYSSWVTEEVRKIAYEKFDSQWQLAVQRIVDYYNLEYKSESELTTEEKETMLTAIKEWKEIPPVP